MIIKVLAKASSKAEKVEKLTEGEYKISVHEPAHDGRANLKIVKVLADYLGIPKTSIKLIHGSKSKIKIFQTLKK